MGQTRNIVIIILLQILNIYYCLNIVFSLAGFEFDENLDIILQATGVRVENPLCFTSCVMAFSLFPDAHLSFLLVRKKQWRKLLAIWEPVQALSGYRSERRMRMLLYKIHFLCLKICSAKKNSSNKNAKAVVFKLSGKCIMIFLKQLKMSSNLFFFFF